jgi:hypothetical protein
MYEFLTAIGHSTYAHGALVGAVAAAGVDFQAFRSWKNFHDAEQYSWSTAIFRWIQGAVLGVVTAVGIGGLQ